MGKDFFDRLDEYMAHSGLNDNKLTVAASLSIGALGKQRKGSRGLSSDSIAKILYAYPDLNGDWLLTGRGQMQYKEEAAAPMGAPPPDPVDVSGRDPNDVKMIAVLERNIATLEKLADAKDETIKSKDNEISRLEKSESDKNLRIKQYEDYIVSCKCKADDGEPDKTPGSEALGDAHCLGDAECFAVGKQSI